MGMTDEEKFRFDLTGFLVRPAILTPDETAELVEHVRKLTHDRESLPEAHRAIPGGPASKLIDHPKVVEVLHEIIGPEIRMEGGFAVWREKGASHGQGLHGGGPRQIDPIFGYRFLNGKIHAGMVRVVFELTDVKPEDGATHFIIGSHKANLPMHEAHMSIVPGERSPFLVGYECPAGSAIFFTENLCHVGPEWTRDTPRVAILHAYAHGATHWHRLRVPKVTMESLPREKQAYFREVWSADFRTRPATRNTVENFVASDEPTVADPDNR